MPEGNALGTYPTDERICQKEKLNAGHGPAARKQIVEDHTTTAAWTSAASSHTCSVYQILETVTTTSTTATTSWTPSLFGGSRVLYAAPSRSHEVGPDIVGPIKRDPTA